jgi:SAM-dependent methyltransferase
MSNLSAFDSLQYRVLSHFWPRPENGSLTSTGLKGAQKLERCFGSEIWQRIASRHVLDFGCGFGHEALALAQRGATTVVGFDIREELLREASRVAWSLGLSETLSFTSQPRSKFDLVLSMDSFEHFADPAGALEFMASLLRRDGRLLVCFGPTWYHPYGGHLFSVFPWSHLLFSERALIAWRADFKRDGATRFSEVEGGLNQMTVCRFEEIVAKSSLEVVELETVPIAKLKRIAAPWNREFTTSVVRGEFRVA